MLACRHVRACMRAPKTPGPLLPRALWMVSAGWRNLKPPSGARDVEVTKRMSSERSAGVMPATTDQNRPTADESGL